MSNLQESPVWVDSIYQLTEETPVLGKMEDIPGAGPSNLQAEQLANRTKWLRQAVDGIQTGDIPFTSEEKAQESINSGETPLNSKFSVRVDNADIWVAEYQNISGIAKPTGKVFPTKEFIDELIIQQLRYRSESNLRSFELQPDDGWTLGTIGTWAVGFIPATQFLNRIDAWINWGTGPHHVNVKIYQRSTDAITDFPGGAGDTLLYSSTIQAADLPMDPALFGYWQRIPFRFPTIWVPTSQSVMIVIESLNADGTHVPCSIGRKNVADVSGLTGSQRGFYSLVASDPATVWRLTDSNRIAVAGWYETLSADAAINKNVNRYLINPVFSVTQNDSGWFGVDPTSTDHLFFAWQRGFPGLTGTFDCVKLLLSNTQLNRRLNYAVTLRLQSSAASTQPGRALKEDVPVYSGIIYPDELMDTNDPQEVVFTFPAVTVSASYFLIFEVLAEGDYRSAGALGVARHNYSGGEARPENVIENGLYRRNSGSWNAIGAPYGIAIQLGTAEMKMARSDIAELGEQIVAVETQVAVNTDELLVSQASEIIRLSDNSSDWSTSALPDASTFSDWCACMPDVSGKISAFKMMLEAVRKNTAVTLTFYSRLKTNLGNAAGPGLLTGDVAVYTQTYDPATLATDNTLQWITFSFPEFTIASNAFLLAAVTTAAGSEMGYLGSGMSQKDIPGAGQRGWYRRRNSTNWNAITNSGAVPYDVSFTGYSSLKDYTLALNSEVQAGVQLRSTRTLTRYYPEAVVSGRVIDLTGSVAQMEGTAQPFATSSVTLDSTAAGTDTVSNYTLKYTTSSAVWTNNPNAYLNRRYINSVVVTRVSDGAVLTQGTDYNYDADGGKLRGLQNIADFAVNVTFGYTRERYDLIYINPFTLTVGVIKGAERDFDATEYLPSLPAMTDAVYSARVVGSAVTLVPVCDLYGLAGDIFGTGDDITILNRANCRALQKTITRVNRGLPVTLIGYGDSITALAVATAPQETPNGETRDSRAHLGNTYPADTMTSKYPGVIPDYGDGSSPSSNHLLIGWNWKLKAFFEQQKGLTVKYLNYGISGTTSTDGVAPTRLGYVLAAGGNLMVLCFGMNDGVTNALYSNMVSIITQAKAAGMDVIVMPVPRTPDAANSRFGEADWLTVNRYVYLAARDAGAAYVPADWLVRPGVGGLGIADVSYCNANLRNHPGGYEMGMYGAALVNMIANCF